MTQPSILSHLASLFTPQTENLATEALAFVLGYSEAARGAVAELAIGLGALLPSDLTYATQATQEDGKRPDLAGKDGEGRVRLLVEAKFWAGLTDAQPCSYLRTLERPGDMLLFVVPAMRIESAWDELLRRVSIDGPPMRGPTSSGDETRTVELEGPGLAVCSWRALLRAIANAAGARGDHRALADVAQLEALCEQMDSDAFLPLTSEELTSQAGRRVIQFGDLAQDVAVKLSTLQIASLKGLSRSVGNGWFGRCVRMKNHGCYVQYSGLHWARWGDSPLWIRVLGPDWKPSPTARDALARSGIPFRDDAGTGCWVPLRIPVGREREGVLASLVDQARALSEALPDAQGPVAPPPAGAEAEEEG